MKKLNLTVIFLFLISFSFGQVSFDTVYIVKQVHPTYDEVYDLLVSRKAEIESKGGWVEKDMQDLAKHVANSKSGVSVRYINRKFKKLNITAVWINTIDHSDITSHGSYHIEFAHALTVSKNGSKMIYTIMTLFNDRGESVIEGWDDFFKQLKKINRRTHRQ